MRICFLLPEVSVPGGRVRTIYHLAGAMADRHDVEIVSVGKTLERVPYEAPDGVTLVPLREQHALDERIEHSHGAVLVGTSPPLNLLIARLAPPDAITIGQEHFNIRVQRRDPRRVKAMRTWYPKLDAYVTLTQRDAAGYRQLIGRGPIVQAIPNAIGDPGDQWADHTAKIAVAAGRLERVKGYDLLLEAWRDVVDWAPDWKLRILGEGSERPALEAQREMLGLADAVELPGFTDQMLVEMAKGSFFVLSSRSEGLPMAMLEAMSVGLPVVSFDCYTGPRDILSFGVDGYLVAGQRVDGLAAAMKAMIAAGPERVKLGKAAARTAQRYRLPAVIEQWERLLQRLAARRDARNGDARERVIAPGA